MVPDRDGRIDQICHAALALETARREAFVAEACAGDEALRREIESRLRQQSKADGFRAEPALEASAHRLTSESAHALIGRQVGAYHIQSLLGTGGMGEVYRARDGRLGRDVAIKILPRLFVTESERLARFEREARMLASLNHPHVGAIYGLQDIDGIPALVLELVDGETLAERIARGPLPLGEALRIATEIASALEAAHGRGITHRDLKPANIKITPDGTVKVLDFGLAKVTGDSATGVTQAPTITIGDTLDGAILGTAPYMSPEQARGNPVDKRTDIWAFGCVLFEMLTGHAAFRGDTQTDTLAAIIEREPQWTMVPPSAPAAVRRLLQRCLEKDSRRRLHDIADARIEIEEVRSGTDASAGMHASDRSQLATRLAGAPLVRGFHVPRGAALAALGMLAVLLAWLYVFTGRQAPPIRSIAVVPFVNVGSSPDTEYLSDGITESVINSLAQLPEGQLKVIALNSVLRYKGREVDPQALGRELAVGAVVIGRVVPRPGTLAVSAELVNVSDKSRMWGATYNTKLADVLAMQDEIATQISDSLRLRLNRDTRGKLTKRYTENIEAYQLYLKGRYVWNKYTDAGWTKSIDYFHQALDVDPNYALAWAGTADAYYQLSSIVLPPSEAIPRARAAAMKALEIDERLGEAHASLGIIKSQYDWDRKGAEKEFRRAIDLNPNYASAHEWFGMYYFADGRFDQALAEFRKAKQLDPFSLIIAVTATWPLPQLGRHAEAVQELQKVRDMFPDVPEIASYWHELRGELYILDGKYDDAIAEFLVGYRTKLLTGDNEETLADLRKAYKTAGMTGYYQKQLDIAAERLRHELDRAKQQSPARYVSPYGLAELHARLGHGDEAFSLLQQCYENRDERLVWIKAESLRVGSSWEHLRSDPRFKDLLRRLGLSS